MKDTVFIKSLSVNTTIGIYDWEKKIKQTLLFDIEMQHDNRKPAQSDNIKDALDYEQTSNLIIDYVSSRSFLLVERVAEEVAELILVNTPAESVRLTLTKVDAIKQAKGVGIIIERHRNNDLN